MKILLTNDDGVYAQGLSCLAQKLALLGEVIVVAPDRNRSAASNSLTLQTPLRVHRIKDNVYSVEGTPTDCVHFALNELMKDDLPELVVSGINHGANLGDDVLYSGTVAAAMEGHFLGIQSLAISLAGKQYFETAADVAFDLVSRHITNKIPEHRLININVPDRPLLDLKGTLVTRLGSRNHNEQMIKQLDPRGHEIYWLGPPGVPIDAGTGTDFDAIKQGYVSLTPLQVDLTAHQSIDLVRNWL